jgi:dipeptidyl aminopeptidase/acylaminoacyl peptidase
MRRDGVVVGAVAVLAAMVLAPVAHATFPGANGQLAYQLGATIRIASPDGTGQSRNITGGANRDPAWSPDGTRLAFTHRGSGDDNIDVLDLTETDKAKRIRRMVSSPAADTDPAWSPDGRRFVFMSTRSGNADLWINDTVTHKSRQLTSGPASDQMPSWSASNVIVFASNRSGNFDLYTMAPVPGAPATQVTSDPADDIDPSWSPDGAQIAFTVAAGGVGQINAVTANGGGMHAVAPGGPPQRFPHWAPDGSAIEYTAGGGITIADGSTATPTVTPLATVAPGGVDADWGPLPKPAQAAVDAGRFITVRPAAGPVQAVPGARPVADAVASQLSATATLPVGGNAVVSVNTTADATAVVRAATETDAAAPSAVLQSTDAVIRQPQDTSKLDVTLTSPPIGCGPTGVAALAPAGLASLAKTPPRARLTGFGRASGRHARTGTKGTTWIIAETCAGTVTLVLDGSVDVVDFSNGRTRSIAAPGCFVATNDRTVTRAEKSAACAQVKALPR